MNFYQKIFMVNLQIDLEFKHNTGIICQPKQDYSVRGTQRPNVSGIFSNGFLFFISAFSKFTASLKIFICSGYLRGTLVVSEGLGGF